MSTTQNLPLIAGQRAGKPIRCITKLEPVFQRLQQAARRNHYWATIAVKELNALTTGVLGKNNVYVRPGKSRTKNSNELYYVFLPGLKATVVRWPDDQFCITELNLDDNYFRATEQYADRTRMGLYRAFRDKDQSAWDLKPVPDGKVFRLPGRLVAVADSGYENADDAARYTIPGALEFLGKNTAGVRESGCDLHFTPGQKRLGGMLRYNPLEVNTSRASAVQLAATMEGARDIKNVSWVADFGGSAVLTQAMQILVNKGVKLKGHTAYLHRPRTSPAKALRLAHKLELTLNESFANTGLSLRGTLSQFSVAGVRLSNKNDAYNRGHHAQAWFKGTVAMSTPVGIAATVMGGAQAMVVVGSIATAIGGVGVAYSIGQSLAEDLRRRFKL
ncbi:hypothetical protein OQJ62_10970 [Microbulbifer thermotolerans]|uniref:hypothetical protein n=1 Tax=Microbulbifer thermotolerans TaxID=252514 RepID=UPI002249274E|nr:hypothetical protein [Microbulbifer thermotolerans]MCX2795442.1 hypothetical protein [Microbulbifer thermotolerans]